MARALVALFAATVFSAAACGGQAFTGRFYSQPYEELPKGDPGTEHITIHVVPHTHDDVGWVKTADEYYLTEVQWILDTVIQCLKDNPERRFTYVEMAFFYRWWNEQSEAMKSDVRRLVQGGQLEFNLAGWSMNDEANTIYWQEIDQMTEGMQFLARELGVAPTVGWHIDPFGHSAATPSMWAQMGMHAFGFWRIHYAVAEELARTKEMEFVWRSSASLGADTDMWCYIMPYAYCSPVECSYDNDLIVNNDPLLPTYAENIAYQAGDFVEMARSRLQFVRHTHVLIPFGNDFAHQNGFKSFAQMDKLIAFVNSQPALNATVLYSTFATYARAVNALNITWPVRTPAQGDFFPYADRPHAYLTGFYTSRPALKQYIRTRAVVARVAEFLFSWSSVTGVPFEPAPALRNITVMRQALGTAQHHDAVSGTEKSAVAADYHLQLQQGTEACAAVIDRLAGSAVAGPGGQPSLTVDATALGRLQAGEFLPIVVYNSLAWSRSDFVSILTARGDLAVVDDQGANIPCQINPIGTFSLDYVNGTAAYRLFFQPTVPAMGTRAYFVKVDSRAIVGKVVHDIRPINNSFYSLKFGSAGNLHAITNIATGAASKVDHEYYEYVSASQTEMNSGAYTFRPEQGSRIFFGDNHDPFQQRVDSLWEFVEQFPETAKVAVFVTPRADAQFPDTFAANTIGLLNNKNFTATLGRIDGPHPSIDPWDQPVNVDFLTVDTTAPFFPGFQIGSHFVGPNAKKFVAIEIPFESTFSESPRLLVNMRGTKFNYNLFVPSVISVTPTGFIVNCSIFDGSSWREPVYLDWLAWDTVAARNLPASHSEGMAEVTVSSAGQLAQFNITLSPSLYSIDPIVVASAVSASHPVALTACVISGAAFQMNVACVGCSFRAGDTLRLNWLAFLRPFFGSAINRGQVTGGATVIGPFVTEVWQPFRENYATQTLRLYRGSSEDLAHIETVSDIGPLDSGRELVTRFRTSFQTATSPTTGVFYTEDNGLETIQRTYNTMIDEPIAGNYFPAPQRAFLREPDASLQFTLVGNSAHGCGSNFSGQIELMLQRRCSADDGYGVGEILDDTDHVAPTISILLDTPVRSSKLHRRLALLMEFPGFLFFGTPVRNIADYSSKYSTRTSSLAEEFPPNIHLLSFNAQDGTDAIILRLQHLFPAGEHPTLSAPVTLDLAALFQKISPISIEETTLTANQHIAEVRRPSWRTEDTAPGAGTTSSGWEGDRYAVTMHPRELRTFLVRF